VTYVLAFQAAKRAALLNQREETVLLAEGRLEAATEKLEARQADIEKLQRSLEGREKEAQEMQVSLDLCVIHNVRGFRFHLHSRLGYK
jgi:DNA-directed RNA polymerase subunit K/omega